MRKLSQAERLLRLLSDGTPHSTPEIQSVVYGSTHLGTARIASRVNDLRNRGLTIQGYKDRENPAIYWYRITDTPKPRPKMEPERVFVDGMWKVRLVPSSTQEVQPHQEPSPQQWG